MKSSSQPKGERATTPSVPAKSQGDSRDRRLASMNEYLAAQGHHSLKKTGDWKQGETELDREVQAGHRNRWYSIEEFRTIQPTGETGHFFLRFHAMSATRRAMIVIPMVNDMLVFTREYRVAVQDWKTEFPRHFAVSRDQLTMLDEKMIALAGKTEIGRETPYHELPLSVLAQEATQLMMRKDLVVEAMVRLSEDHAHDTGFDTTESDVWLVKMRVHDAVSLKGLRGTKAMGIRLYPLATVFRDRRALGINDALTLSALYLLIEHLGLIRSP